MQDKDPGLVLLPIQYAFEASAERADIQIFDESFWQASTHEASVALTSLSLQVSVPARGTGADLAASADLADARAKLRKAFEIAGEDNIPPTAQPREAGITIEIAKRAKGIEHQRGDTIIRRFRPGMPASTLQRLWEGFEHRDARRWARAWQDD